MATHYQGAKVTAEEANADPYAVLRTKAPVLRNLTKDTFPNYMSLVAAASRAVEAKNENPILNDMFAEPLAGPAGAAFLEFFQVSSTDMDGVGYCVIRHIVIDDEIEQNLNPDIHQVVVVGSGMDSRSYRLQRLANCHVFELDAGGDLAEHKQKVLKEINATLIPKEHDVIITDFEKFTWPDELVEHGFDPKKPTLWVIEALLGYISEASVDRLMITMDKLSAPNSVALVEMCGTGAVNMDIVVDDDRVAWRIGNRENTHRGGVLRALPWNIEMLMHRTEDGVYSGRRWDPVKYARYHIPKDKMKVGTYFVASCTKPNPPGEM